MEKSMRLNKEAVLIEKSSKEYMQLERILKKIAAQNNIEGICSVNLTVKQDSGVAIFNTGE
jgi:hypothetical protein